MGANGTRPFLRPPFFEGDCRARPRARRRRERRTAVFTDVQQGRTV